MAAGWILWKGWRRLARRDSAVGRIAGAGLILRAFAAQVLFWVSYLRLPVARRLQDGDGFWKFAIDSQIYFGDSWILLGKGWHSLILVNRTLPSPAFLQVFAVFLMLFGAVASVGALLNLFAYWACCEAVLRLGRLEGSSRRPTLIALAALSFSPSLVLWSTQPLKDAFFLSVVAVFVMACAQWRKGWLAAGARWRPLASSFVLLIVTLYAIVGIRWYFGILMCLVSFPFLLVTAVQSRRRVVTGIVNALLFLLMLQVVLFVGGPYLPAPLARMLKGAGAPTEAAQNLVSVVEKSRRGFDAAGGMSQIQEGEALAHVDRTMPPEPEVETESPADARQLQHAGSVPRSIIGRITAGMAAVVVPRFISESLGIIHVGGGGLWPVVEADTLLFDMLLLIVIFTVVSAAPAGGLRDPSFWLVALMTGGIAILLTYTISNFGTLFRHRSMILLGLALLLAVTRVSPPVSTNSEPVS
ncbi:MAG TPA: hypothetical protein VN380_18855 [Thermoanaerobaculia bacterium]|nr:hypothetical protein [Thermoanaerobaculia bacterium]